jgi:hypothetical protein
MILAYYCHKAVEVIPLIPKLGAIHQKYFVFLQEPHTNRRLAKVRAGLQMVASKSAPRSRTAGAFGSANLMIFLKIKM